MEPEQQQAISELEKVVTQPVPFSLYHPHSNIILEVSATSTYADWNLCKKPKVTSGILDQRISRCGI